MFCFLSLSDIDQVAFCCMQAVSLYSEQFHLTIELVLESKGAKIVVTFK